MFGFNSIHHQVFYGISYFIFFYDIHHSKLSIGDFSLQTTSSLINHGPNATVTLVESLHKNGIFYTGTVRPNRIAGCQLKNEKPMKKDGRGSYNYKTREDLGCCEMV